MLGDEREKILRQMENAIETYDRMISKEASKEAARHILPFTQAVGIYHVTMNLRSLQNSMFNFIKNKKLEYPKFIRGIALWKGFFLGGRRIT